MDALAAGVFESNYCWHHQQDGYLMSEELLNMSTSSELLNNETAAAPPPAYADSKAGDNGDDDDDEEEGPRRRRRESMLNKLISTVYSGPTISDIESALSFTGGGGDHHQQLAVDARSKYNSSSSPVVFSPEKVLSKMENKYTLKIKTCGSNGLAEDGYKWRKYGQKSIKNSPNPRSYYRCTNPRCNAKKQVERAMDEPDTLLVTYEGLHLHYTYSHFLHAAQQQQQGLPKKPKRVPEPDLGGPAQSLAPAAASPAHAGASSSSAAADYFDDDEFQQAKGLLISSMNEQEVEEEHIKVASNGLLEDVVPLLVRQPSTSTTGSSPPSIESSPSLSTSSVAWTPYIDMAILSNIF